MTVAKSIAAICLAIALAAPPAALASPAGSEYLPQVPKSPKKDSGPDRSSSGSGGSSSTESSSAAPTVTDSTPSYTDSTDSTDSGGSPAKREQPTKEKEKPKAKPAPLKLAPVSADTAGSGDLLPVALLLGLGGMILFGGVILRRQRGRRLRDPARGTAR